ncbi:type II toxin-antitoxin system VapC family toxin [Sphingobium sp. EP60837]|uniref:type II toxin-antitoxin system VapC family toxin n=1 Tax=Sphingobium sp. EP60837 TaxID=1855519 RepID=UPI00082EB204|nr:type II toxin-antitoxin system VapC family toxin [Sphingobium sp. EP60837]
MILVDTSVWIDHFRHDDPALARSLDQRQVLSHPFVIGELALGSLRQRDLILEALRGLPSALVAHDDEVHAFIDRHRLFGLGIGYIDAHLLAATCLTPDACFWTRDKRLRAAASQLGVGATLDQ